MGQYQGRVLQLRITSAIRRDDRYGAMTIVGALIVVSENRTETAIPRMGDRLLLRMAQAAERLGVGRSTIYELTARGELEVVHIGRSARVPAAALDDFVRRLRGQTVTNPCHRAARE